MNDPIGDMIQKDTQRVEKALTLAQRALGAAATIAAQEIRNLPFGVPERAEAYQRIVATLTRGHIPRETVESMERAAARIRAGRPERWVPFPTTIFTRAITPETTERWERGLRRMVGE
jgi:hypothetical protein